jgi:hypothetical protein
VGIDSEGGERQRRMVESKGYIEKNYSKDAVLCESIVSVVQKKG